MATYRIAHQLSDDNRITTCDNDYELIIFVNLIQEENEDKPTHNLQECIDYINEFCDELKFLDDEKEQSFQFHFDEKHTVWLRYTFNVSANTQEEAQEKVLEMYRENDFPYMEGEIIQDTLYTMDLDENEGAATIELVNPDGDIFFKNGE